MNPNNQPVSRSIALVKLHNEYQWKCTTCDWIAPFTNNPSTAIDSYSAHLCALNSNRNGHGTIKAAYLKDKENT